MVFTVHFVEILQKIKSASRPYILYELLTKETIHMATRKYTTEVSFVYL